MLSDIEFLSWCEKNNITKKTREYIECNIRKSQPSRTVGNGEVSTNGRYPSRKMGVTIQWESGKVEGPAVLMLENDDDVLEYYDQPARIKLNYINNSGKNSGTLYTPDFFVIRKKRAGWEEWKHEDDINKIAKKQPWKYKNDKELGWICPPGNEVAKEYGLTFDVCTTRKINWTLHRNYVFLDDYLRHKNSLEIKKEPLEIIKQIIFQEPSVTLKELIDRSNGKYTTDDIFISIIHGEIYVDVNEYVLAEPETVMVFLHKEHYKMYKNIIDCNTETPNPEVISIETGSKILWDGSIWTIVNVGETSISLLSEECLNELPLHIFHQLIAEEKIVGQKIEESKDNTILDIITGASEDDYEIANFRLPHVKNYLEKGSKYFDSDTSPKIRTVRDWVSKYRQAENLFGNGYIGLLPEEKNKGNRTERFNIEVYQLMDHFIENDYETMVQKNKSVVYGAFANKCEEKGYMTPSLASFCKRVKERPIEIQTKKRKGKRSAYQEKTFYWELEMTTPRHGDFPFNIGHLDHTELDIELICSRTGKNLGRPYLTLLIDAFSRKVLAFYLSFEQPSYRSCMMVFRNCVKRYNRLPQQIVVDNGREFHSVYFESLLAMYEREPRRRPPAQPRYGSILERLFGTTNTNFIHNLIGNTKIMKNVREVTKSVNPKNLAEWSLLKLSAALEEYFFGIYENLEHPALGEHPRGIFEKGLFYSGERKNFYIAYDDLFEILTLPSTRSGEAKIQKSGIKVNYIYYWNDEFKSLHNLSKKVKVRYDPFNIGICYAFVNKRWVKCISEYYSKFKNLTQKELKFITSELKKSKQNHSKTFVINAKRIAEFITDLESNDKYYLLKAKSDETKNVIFANFKGSNTKEASSEEIVCEKILEEEKEEVSNNLANEYKLEIYGEF
ncbi:transposase InsO family protein/23S rRNA pseudoU1915 N3-methylase RlmH [Metabacillus crassostreae]|uniref:TnsA endonuclease N-terminal domain-containing protein n=1 Tax=Metabacillus crassostreae TaxID=929098 RepID=UPI0019598B8F|nr:TnsA endonuclease N-terminal domain-containing protein [Metabacillus crassostreae]MBM7605938.1 transposase InsO family protein/23S rRNA pseudoU1915 N3-methylase RlmH [Metabacillus crassostreae]